MKIKVKILMVVAMVSIGFIFIENVNAENLQPKSVVKYERIEGLSRIETTRYTPSQILSYESEGKFITFTFTDGSTITVDNELGEFDVESFELFVEETYDLISSRAGGAINFPNSISVTATGYGTSNYPPNQKFVSGTRRKAYRERIYIANYSGNIPHTSTQGSTGGGKTYIYSGSIPYKSHSMVQP